MLSPEIYFYIPKDKFNQDWPKSLADNWVAFGGGANVWTYFTAIVLNEFGYRVNITTTLPEQGVVLSHAQYLPQWRVVNKKTLVICIRADYGRNHPADMHIVQNAFQQKLRGREVLEHLLFPGPNYHIPYWPQPGLLPRNKERGREFKNVAFVGARQNIADFCKSEQWIEALSAKGIDFKIISDRSSWHDYSEIDAVLAVRPASGDSHYRKPPSKLTNAWLAGVPAILGPDSAFRELRRSPWDYIEVNNEKQAFEAILSLRDDFDLRLKMIKNGEARSREYTVKANFERWKVFFDDFAIPYYEEWIGWGLAKKNIYFMSKQLRAAVKR